MLSLVANSWSIDIYMGVDQKHSTTNRYKDAYIYCMSYILTCTFAYIVYTYTCICIFHFFLFFFFGESNQDTVIRDRLSYVRILDYKYVGHMYLHIQDWTLCICKCMYLIYNPLTLTNKWCWWLLDAFLPIGQTWAVKLFVIFFYFFFWFFKIFLPSYILAR